MAVMNFTTEAESFREDLCFPATEETNETLHVLMARVAISVCNIFFSICAVLGNILIFIAFYKESSFHPPSKLLFRCLAATDLCVGVITQPAFVVYQLSIVAKRLHVCHFAAALSYITTTILCGVSLATLTAISIDRLLALLLKMRYRQVVTLNRVRVAVTLFWLLSFAVSMLVFGNRLVYFSLSCALTLLSVVASTICYMKIFFTLRHKRTKVQDDTNCLQGQPNGQLNGTTSQQIGSRYSRYQKTVSSALVFHLVLISCYLPYVVVRVLMAVAGRRSLVWEAVAASIIFLNSSLNPIFYCWKIKEIRYEVKQMVRKTFCLQH